MAGMVVSKPVSKTTMCVVAGLVWATLGLAHCGKGDSNATDAGADTSDSATADGFEVQTNPDGSTATGNCSGVGGSCAERACCTGSVCTPDSAGALLCVAALSFEKPVGALCTKAAECDSLACDGSQCVAASVATLCKTSGTSCAEAHECCSGLCTGGSREPRHGGQS